VKEERLLFQSRSQKMRDTPRSPENITANFAIEKTSAAKPFQGDFLLDTYESQKSLLQTNQSTSSPMSSSMSASRKRLP
jgi:hypothetical protein